MNITNLLNTLQHDCKGTKAKTQAIASVADSETLKLLELALSPRITFGVKKFTVSGPFAETDPSLKAFFDLANQLANRELTGHAAQAAIDQTLSLYTEQTADALARVLRQNLEVGIGASLVNKARGEKLIPTFDVMLADKMSPKFSWSSGPWFVEYKYDGMRWAVFTDLKTSTVAAYSRDGALQSNVPPEIEAQLIQLATAFGQDIVFDGEILGTSFNSTMSLVKKGDDKLDRSTLNFIVFDLLTRTEWDNQDSPTFDIRRSRLESVIRAGKLSDPLIRPSEGCPCTTREQVQAYYLELVDLGAEGVIIKTAKHKYQWKRAKTWVKYKPVYTADLTIDGVYEGKDEFVGMLGGFNLSGYLEDGTFVRTNCGSGFKVLIHEEYSRIVLWEKREELIGLTAEVEYQEVTKAKNNDVPALRFVVFKGIRIDK